MTTDSRGVRLHYLTDEVRIELDEPCTILDASLTHGIAHFHTCGGTARCSTCRVRIVSGIEACSPPTASEAKLLARRQFGPGVRLACQTWVRGTVALRRLVLDTDDYALVQLEDGSADDQAHAHGEERDVAILFADIRDFTRFSETQLPYDVIHVLNRYFHRASAVVSAHGGRVVNLMGDGVMALFGLKTPETAAVDGVRAGLALLAEVAAMKPYLEAQFRVPLRIGVGLHYGPCVVGTVGNRHYRQFTAIGDSVNLAARIESATKEAGCDFLVSDPVRQRVQDQVRFGRSVESNLKGKTGAYVLHEVLEQLPPGHLPD